MIISTPIADKREYQTNVQLSFYLISYCSAKQIIDRLMNCFYIPVCCVTTAEIFPHGPATFPSRLKIFHLARKYFINCDTMNQLHTVCTKLFHRA